jgi:hypothetical protein
MILQTVTTGHDGVSIHVSRRFEGIIVSYLGSSGPKNANNATRFTKALYRVLCTV